MDNNFSEHKSFVEEYDLFGKVFPFHDDLQNQVAQSLSETITEPSPTFLDIGAGYGFTTKLVAAKFPQGRFILNEFDEFLLGKSDEYLAGVTFEKRPGDIEEIIKQIPDASIDGVYSAWVLHNFPPAKRRVIFEHIGRILKKGGMFVNLDKVGDTGPQRVKDLAQAIIDLEPFNSKHGRPELFVEWVKHDLRDEEPDLVFTDQENESLLSSNGFTWEYAKHILLEKVVVAKKH